MSVFELGKVQSGKFRSGSLTNNDYIIHHHMCMFYLKYPLVIAPWTDYLPTAY